MKNNKNKTKNIAIGGQALIEGIMMRGPDTTAMAVRNMKGEVILEKWDTPPPSKTKNIPIVRGIVALGTSLKVGYRCLMRSSEIALADQLDDLDSQELDATTDDSIEPLKSVESFEEIEEIENAQTMAELAQLDNTFDTPKAEFTPSEAEATPAADTSDTSSKQEPKQSKKETFFMSVLTIFAAILGVGLAVVLFMFLPQLLFSIPDNLFGWYQSMSDGMYRFVRSGIVGIIRITLFVAYMAATSLMKDIRRTFMYHGAEHKAIYCYEKGLPLTVENVKAQPRLHPRCGTSFLIFMLLIGIFVGFFVPAHFGAFARMGINLLLLPLVVGLGYEAIRLAGKKRDTGIVKFISAPGMWLQRISTREPEDDMLEVAIKALVEVLPKDGETVDTCSPCKADESPN